MKYLLCDSHRARHKRCGGKGAMDPVCIGFSVYRTDGIWKHK